jgi:hypothetical protein
MEGGGGAAECADEGEPRVERALADAVRRGDLRAEGLVRW